MRTRDEILRALNDCKADELKAVKREQIKVELLLDIRSLLQEAVAVSNRSELRTLAS